MAEMRTETLSLLVNNKVVEIKRPSKRNFDLNKALNDPSQFQKFADNPRAFVAQFDLQIDPELSDALKAKLQGINDLAALHSTMAGGQQPATAWAVASPAYSLSNSKLLVAF